MHEQIILHNCSYVERTHPDNSFTLACALNLHNNSSNHYEKMRKSTPCILLPGKKTIFQAQKKSSMPEDCFFQHQSQSIHNIVLKNISKK